MIQFSVFFLWGTIFKFKIHEVNPPALFLDWKVFKHWWKAPDESDRANGSKLIFCLQFKAHKQLIAIDYEFLRICLEMQILQSVIESLLNALTDRLWRK